MSIVRTPMNFPLNTYIRTDNEQVNRDYMSFLPQPSKKQNIYERAPNWEAPDLFSGKDVWKVYLSAVCNQGNCGGCYAFASTSALADCFNLRSFGKIHLDLSAARVIMCDLLGQWSSLIQLPLISNEAIEQVYSVYGCEGNTLMEAWAFLYTYGTNTERCFPNSILEKENCSQVSSSQLDRCVDNTPAVFYRAQHIYAVAGTPKDGGNENNIRKIIYKFGPVSTAMAIYSDFYTFDPRAVIYKRSASAIRLTGHAVVLDGWGEEDGVKFWWVRNSWGKEWGIDGYFRIIRGVNHCGIEENVLAGIPDVVLNISSYFEAQFFQDTLLGPSGRRSVMSPYAIFGGIDRDTGLSRHLLSYTKYANWPKKYKVDADPDTYFAGELPTIMPRARSNSIVLVICACVLVLVFILLITFL